MMLVILFDIDWYCVFILWYLDDFLYLQCLIPEVNCTSTVTAVCKERWRAGCQECLGTALLVHGVSTLVVKVLEMWYCLLAVMWSSVLVNSVDVLLGISCAILQHPYSLMLIQSHHSHHETIMVCPVLQIHDVAISWAHPGTWQVGKVGQIGLNNMSGSVSSVG